ncbi:DUF4142 domain-containing protein [Streptomyces sp. NPDC091259]|uniref:DUF4142 domain-containing protein n=1 Tax=Streptomyces sp. NPDC091259 TaxID=3365976 RepID=UPI0037FDFF90
MRNRLLIAAAATVVTAGVCGPAAFAAGQGDTQDTVFLTSVHQGNLAEMAAGQDAQQNATTDCVKTVAARLVSDHQKLDQDLKNVAAQLKTTLPTAPTADQQQKLKDVQAKAKTSAYDSAWLAGQDAAHQSTLALIRLEISSGRDSAAVAAARKAEPVVTMHLDMVRGGTCHAM